MGNLSYLAGAGIFVIAVTLLLLARDRRPTSVVSEVEEFNKGLQALASRQPDPRQHARKG
jgi:hypothetical protein